MKFDAFIGGSNPSESPNVDSERTVNLYLEAAGEGASLPKTPRALYGTPGLVAFATLPTSPVRGIWSSASRLFVVAGSKLYELSSTGSIIGLGGPTDHTARGDVGNDGLPAQVIPNGNQLMIVSAGKVWVDNGTGPVQPVFAGTATGTVTTIAAVGPAFCQVFWASGDQFSIFMQGNSITIAGSPYTVAYVVSPTFLVLSTDAGTNSTPVAYSAASSTGLTASSGAFLDGYFIVNPPQTKQINISTLSTLGGGLTWDPIDFGIKEGYPDNILRIMADHEELWLFGTDTIEVWQNTGAAAFPLARISGGFIHHGLAAEWSPVRLKEGLAYLSTDPARGGTVAYIAMGFAPQRISTHAVETVWDGYTTTADAVAYTYTEHGHEFWVITFPTANATWAFDATSGVWAERGWWNGSSNDRQRQMFHAFAFGMHIVGDWSTGAVYQQSTAFLDDAGTPINWMRTAPHISNEQRWSFYARFQLDMEVGTSTSTPTLYLSWSDDGGHTFSTPVAMDPDAATYAGRVVRRRLGRSRDRVFRVTGVTGSTRVAIVGALLDVQQGIS